MKKIAFDYEKKLASANIRLEAEKNITSEYKEKLSE